MGIAALRPSYRVCQGFGSQAGRGCKKGLLALYFELLGAHPPDPLPGVFTPWTPRFPTLVGSGFASVLGPTRGGVANADNSPPIWVCGGTPPTSPCHGGFAPWTPVFPPSWA